MNRVEILNTIKILAQSQGFYGAFLCCLNEASEAEREALLDKLEAQNFKDVIDLVFYLEGL